MDKKLNNLIKKNLEELKAIDTKILDLSQIDAFTDQLIITTGTSKPHITAISKKITEVLKTNQIKVYGYGKGFQRLGFDRFRRGCFEYYVFLRKRTIRSRKFVGS